MLRVDSRAGRPCHIFKIGHYPLSLLFDEMKHQGAAGLSTLSLVAIATNAIR